MLFIDSNWKTASNRMLCGCFALPFVNVYVQGRKGNLWGELGWSPVGHRDKHMNTCSYRHGSGFQWLYLKVFSQLLCARFALKGSIQNMNYNESSYRTTSTLTAYKIGVEEQKV